MLMSKVLILLYTLATSFALIALKLGSKDGAPVSFLDGRFHMNITPYVLAGIGFYGLSFLLYMYLISKYDLGYIIPLTTAFVYILIFTASYFIFKEGFTLFKVIGIACIIVGLFFLNLRS